MLVNIFNWVDCGSRLQKLGFFTKNNKDFTIKENEPNILTEDEMWDVCKKIKSSGLNLLICGNGKEEINICVDTRRFSQR